MKPGILSSLASRPMSLEFCLGDWFCPPVNILRVTRTYYGMTELDFCRVLWPVTNKRRNYKFTDAFTFKEGNDAL
jgi:hypothetical protein